MTSPGRDVFDVAVCGRADPQALEVAVNALDDTTVDAILRIYKLTREQYDREVAELDGVPEGLEPVQANPTAYANDAILNSRYERVTIRTVAGKAEIETRTRQASARTRTYATAKDLVDGMERDGINAFLRAQYRNEQVVLNDVIGNLWTGRTATIIEIEPGRPRHELLGMPEIRWSPPARMTEGEPANVDRRQPETRL